MRTRLLQRIRKPLLAAAAIGLMIPMAATAGGYGNDHGNGHEDDIRSSQLRFATVKDGNTLVVFAKHGYRSSVAISGLTAGERIVGIDVRPRNPSQLYGIGSTSQVYIIDATSGTATKVGAPFAAALQGTSFGVDFNPAVDRIRIVSNSGQNLRVHPDTGALAATDTSLAFAPTDVNAGSTPSVAGAAYTFAPFNIAPTPPAPTTLYDLESGRDVLATQVPPNNGTLNTVGALKKVDLGDSVGFDIAGTSDFRPFALVQQGGSARLYRVSLDSGKARGTNLTLEGSYDGLAVLNGYDD